MNDYKYTVRFAELQLHSTRSELRQTRNKADRNFNTHNGIAAWK